MSPNTPHVQTYPHIYVFFNFAALLCMDCLLNMVFELKMSLHYESLLYNIHNIDYNSRQFDFVVRFYLPPGRYIHLSDMCISCQNDIIKFRVKMCSRICSDAIHFSIHSILTRTEELLGKIICIPEHCILR